MPRKKQWKCRRRQKLIHHTLQTCTALCPQSWIRAWHVLRSMVEPLAKLTGVGLISLTTRVETRLVPLARQTIRIGQTPASPLSFFLVAWSVTRALLALGDRGGQTFALAPSCSRTFAGCTGGRTSGRALACTGGRTSALALRGGQSTSLASGTTRWRRIDVICLGSGVAGLGSRTRSGTPRRSGGRVSRSGCLITVVAAGDPFRALFFGCALAGAFVSVMLLGMLVDVSREDGRNAEESENDGSGEEG